jgi:hypothetical protein
MGDRESGLWIPASAHKADGYEEEEEEEEEAAAPSIQEHTVEGESRGRQETVAAA